MIVCNGQVFCLVLCICNMSTAALGTLISSMYVVCILVLVYTETSSTCIGRPPGQSMALGGAGELGLSSPFCLQSVDDDRHAARCLLHCRHEFASRRGSPCTDLTNMLEICISKWITLAGFSGSSTGLEVSCPVRAVMAASGDAYFSA